MTKKIQYMPEITGPPFVLYLDLETEGREDAESFAPEFRADARIKDPDKVKADLDGKRKDWLAAAALRGMTGRILVAGVATDDEPVRIIEGEEKAIISEVLELLRKVLAKGGRVFGFNILGFDMPFLVQRAYAHGLTVPKTLYQVWRGRWQWHDNVIDLQPVVLAGQQDIKGYSLGNIAKWLGIGEKTGNGADFAKLYREDKASALAYATKDVELTRYLAERVGIA